MVVFFCEQMTAYEMRISDWSSDVCSSDLVKGRCLTLEVFDVVVGREGNVYRALLIGLGADQLVLAAGDETARADLDRHALALAAFERLALALALEIHEDEVDLPRLLRGLGGGDALLAPGARAETLV